MILKRELKLKHTNTKFLVDFFKSEYLDKILEKKKKKYIGALDYYRVHKGETLYQISQQFGIRVSNLAKMNNLSIFSTLSEGQKLILH